MFDILAHYFHAEGVTLTFFTFFTVLCIISMIAEDKTGEVAAILVGSAVSYVLLCFYGTSSVIELLGQDYLGRAVQSIPFLKVLVGESQNLLALIRSDASIFLDQFLNLYLLVLITDFTLKLIKPFVQWLAKLSNIIVSTIFTWLVRYVGCTAAMLLYSCFHVYILQNLPNHFVTALSYVVFAVMILTLISPLAKYLLVAAKVVSNALMEKFGSFFKDNALGSGLQSSFYAVYFLMAILIILQLTDLRLLPDELRQLLSVLR